jgi:nicotinate-nucleotide adenylyltransferase
MRIALFGGSFDPPHRGHVALARLAIARLRLDRVLIAPVGTQPLKQEAITASFEDRVAMVRLAFAGEAKMEVSLVDAARADGRPNYTIDTIRELKPSLSAEDKIFYLMGADSWLTIGKWYRAAELLMACDFIVGARPGFDLGHLTAALPKDISAATEDSFPADQETDAAGGVFLTLSGAGGGHTRLYLLPDLAENISATEVRAALSRGFGESATVLDQRVAKYIHEHKLYRV